MPRKLTEEPVARTGILQRETVKAQLSLCHDNETVLEAGLRIAKESKRCCPSGGGLHECEPLHVFSGLRKSCYDYYDSL